MGRLTRILLPGLLLLSVYYAVFGGRFSIFEVHDAGREVERAGEELERLRIENDSLAAWVDALENDPVVLERFARDNYRMIYPGERVYVIEYADALVDDEGDPDGVG